MNNPKILFADEPTGALNSKASEEIMDILIKVNQEGNTIMLVTHDARVAAMSDRVVFMMDGEVEREVVLGKYAGEDEHPKRVQKISNVMQELEI